MCGKYRLVLFLDWEGSLKVKVRHDAVRRPYLPFNTPLRRPLVPPLLSGVGLASREAESDACDTPPTGPVVPYTRRRTGVGDPVPRGDDMGSTSTPRFGGGRLLVARRSGPTGRGTS